MTRAVRTLRNTIIVPIIGKIRTVVDRWVGNTGCGGGGGNILVYYIIGWQWFSLGWIVGWLPMMMIELLVANKTGKKENCAKGATSDRDTSIQQSTVLSFSLSR